MSQNKESACEYHSDVGGKEGGRFTLEKQSEIEVTKTGDKKGKGCPRQGNRDLKTAPTQLEESEAKE